MQIQLTIPATMQAQDATSQKTYTLIKDNGISQKLITPVNGSPFYISVIGFTVVENQSNVTMGRTYLALSNTYLDVA